MTDQELRELFDILQDAYTIYRRQQADRERGRGEQHDQGNTYHRTPGAVALTGELAAIRRQTADSAGLTEEYSAADYLPIPAAWDDDAQCLAVVFRGRVGKAAMVDLTCQHTNHTVLVEGQKSWSTR